MFRFGVSSTGFQVRGFGLGMGVWGSGFSWFGVSRLRVSGSVFGRSGFRNGFRVRGSRFRGFVLGVRGFNVPGLVFRGSGCRVWCFQVPGLGFWVRGGGVGVFKVRDSGFHVRCPGFAVF